MLMSYPTLELSSSGLTLVHLSAKPIPVFGTGSLWSANMVFDARTIEDSTLPIQHVFEVDC